jgi:hypothetical protein
MINKYSAILGIVSTLFLGAIAYPVSAQTNDPNTAQNASQGVSIDGNNNTVYQTINQTTINRNRSSRGQEKNAFSPEDTSKKHNNWKEKEERKQEKRERKENRD